MPFICSNEAKSFNDVNNKILIRIITTEVK